MSMSFFKCADAVCLDGKLWTIDHYGWAVYSIDLKDWSLKQEAIIKEHAPIQYRKVILINEMLYFILNDCIGVFRYDLVHKQGETYKLEGADADNITGAYVYKEKIIIIPSCMSAAFYSFDVNTCRFHRFDISFRTSEEKGQTFISSACIAEDRLWFIKNQGQMIWSYDFLTKKTEQYLLPDGISVGGVIYWDHAFFLISLSGYQLYEWDAAKGITERYFFKGLSGPEDKYARIVVCCGQLYILSVLSDGIYKVSRENKEIEKIYEVQTDTSRKALFIENLVIGEKIILLPWRAKYITEINCKTGEINEHKICLKKEHLSALYDVWVKEGCLLYENADMNGRNLIEEIIRTAGSVKEMKETAPKGALIYKSVKTLL